MENGSRTPCVFGGNNMFFVKQRHFKKNSVLYSYPQDCNSILETKKVNNTPNGIVNEE